MEGQQRRTPTPAAEFRCWSRQVRHDINPCCRGELPLPLFLGLFALLFLVMDILLMVMAFDAQKKRDLKQQQMIFSSHVLASSMVRFLQPSVSSMAHLLTQLYLLDPPDGPEQGAWRVPIRSGICSCCRGGNWLPSEENDALTEIMILQFIQWNQNFEADYGSV